MLVPASHRSTDRRHISTTTQRKILPRYDNGAAQITISRRKRTCNKRSIKILYERLLICFFIYEHNLLLSTCVHMDKTSATADLAEQVELSLSTGAHLS